MGLSIFLERGTRRETVPSTPKKRHPVGKREPPGMEPYGAVVPRKTIHVPSHHPPTLRSFQAFLGATLVGSPTKSPRRPEASPVTSAAVATKQVEVQGYGPGGAAVVVEAMTDNMNRTRSAIRDAFNSVKGEMKKPGSWEFGGMLV